MENKHKHRKPHKFSGSEIDFICEQSRYFSFYKVTKLFNKKFGLDISCTTICRIAKRHGVKCSITTKKTYNSTIFIPGHKPHTTKPLGSEFVCDNGYIKIKVGEPNVWRLKHHVLYEKYTGCKLTKYDCVIFLDGDKNNFSENNLLKISRSELAILQKIKMKDRYILETKLLISKIRSLAIKKSKY